MTPSAAFREVWVIDFEFVAVSGERPTPICMVGHELVSGRVLKLSESDLRERHAPPYALGPNVLTVAFYAPAEMSCYRVLQWELPTNIVDLYVEFRVLTNGVPPLFGHSLLGACHSFGIDTIDEADKDAMRQLAVRGGPWTPDEMQALLAYCEQDVVSTARLFTRMWPHIDLPRALLRGRYTAAVACMEHTGIPIDTATLTQLRAQWHNIQGALIAQVDEQYGVYEGRTFKTDRFEQFLTRHGIPWPRVNSGALALDDDTFRERAQAFPKLSALRELRASLSQLRLEDLAVGHDGRNRTMLSPFRAKTGRNQPSTSRFAFGPSVWVRSLIQPAPGFGLAYIDWEQQEFGIAAALSGDSQMMAAYETGDPYLAFAKQARAVPNGATKETHATIRERFKACALGVQYGMGANALALRIGESPAHAQELLRVHRSTYPQFWVWSDAAVDYGLLHGTLHTVFGWTLHVGPEVNGRSLRNFPMQANGAEMLRVACCFCTEAGVAVCAPIHDALLIEAPLEELDAALARTQQQMSNASASVLRGVRLRTDALIIRSPNRYQDKRGAEMWTMVTELLSRTEEEQEQQQPLLDGAKRTFVQVQ
jgi:hypothetical protein